jgi:hypothetical protein
MKFLVLDGHFNLGESKLPPSPPNRRGDGQETVSLLRRRLHLAVRGGIWVASDAMALGIAPEICWALQAADKGAEKPGLQALYRSPAGARRVEAPQPGQPTPGQTNDRTRFQKQLSPCYCTSATGAKGRQLLGICYAVQRNVMRALAGPPMEGQAPRNLTASDRSQRLLARPAWIPPPLSAAADARHRPGDEMEVSMATSQCQRTRDRRCQSPVCLVLST